MTHAMPLARCGGLVAAAPAAARGSTRPRRMQQQQRWHCAHDPGAFNPTTDMLGETAALENSRSYARTCCFSRHMLCAFSV